MPKVRLEPATPQSRVKHTTNALLTYMNYGSRSGWKAMTVHFYGWLLGMGKEKNFWLAATL